MKKNAFLSLSVLMLVSELTFGQYTPVSGPIILPSDTTISWLEITNDTFEAAITIDTSEPVQILNCIIRSKGPHIYSVGDEADVTIKNCYAYGLNPNVAGELPGRFAVLETYKNVTIENNYLEGTTGILIKNAPVQSNDDDKHINIRYNRVRNINGRFSDGNDGYTNEDPNTGDETRTFLQLSMVHRKKNIQIAWNEIVNEPFKSQVEDNINIYKSSGFSSSEPLTIHDNYIQGGYSCVPLTVGGLYKGGGILLGDGDYSPDSTLASSYVLATGNQVVSTTNYGIGTAVGYHTVITDNRVVSSGKIGTEEIVDQNVGIYIENRSSVSFFSHNTAVGNTIGWYKNNYLGTNNYNFVHCDPSYVGCAELNIRLPICGLVDPPCSSLCDYERNEFLIWKNKVANAGIVLGPDNSQNFGGSTFSNNIDNLYEITFETGAILSSPIPNPPITVSAGNKITLKAGAVLQSAVTLAINRHEVIAPCDYPLPPSGARVASKNMEQEHVTPSEELGTFEVYPNPTNGYLTLKNSQPNPHQVVVEIIDLSGKVLKVICYQDTIVPFEETIDISNYKKGVYFIRLRSTTFNCNKKFVVF